MRRVTVAGVVGAVVVVASAQQLGSRPDYWPATKGDPVVQEWYSDIPWNQKLGSYVGNQINQAIVMPYGALGKTETDFCSTKGYSEAKCMIELGITNVLGVWRTDTPYDPADARIMAADCKAVPCIEVKLELSSWYSRVEDSQVKLAMRMFGDLAKPPTYGGIVFTDGSTYAPQMPWYMSHYCDSQLKGTDVQDPVCYGDYFSPFNDGFHFFGGGITDWPKSLPWSLNPARADNFCKENLPTCTMVLAGFNLREVQQNVTNQNFQYQKYNQFLLTWFNDALANFRTDFSLAQRQRHFPWDGERVSWENFLYPQAIQNPFLGEFDNIKTEEARDLGCDINLTGHVPEAPTNCIQTTKFRASPMVYPRQCTLDDLARGDAAKLRKCGLNYEVHPNGFQDQWPASYREGWQQANQYGRTSFLFAGVHGMQMPVTLYKDPAGASGLSVREQVHNSSLFSLYLPIANEADTKRAYTGRNYTDTGFYHTLLMSNHMESDPHHFAEGLRGKVLWHNEYRSFEMYDAFANRGSANYPTMMFAAAFSADAATAPFHGNTCDSCHVRNGSGVPINTSMMLDATMTKEYMRATRYEPYVPKKDYTFTGEIRPMKLVFFDLKRDTTRLDGSRYSEPLAFKAAMIANGPRTMGPGDHYYNNKIMNYYGDSFHVTAPGYRYDWSYVPATASQKVVNEERRNVELNRVYTPYQVAAVGFQVTDPLCSVVSPSPTTKPWPANCTEVNGDAIKAAIDSGAVGYMLLNGKRLGNASSIEAIPNKAIMGFRESQIALLGEKIAGELIWSSGSRDGVGGKVKKDCRTKSLTDCFIGRFGWLGDRASLEDQVANAAFVEMNMTTSEGYAKLYPSDNVAFPIRYAHPNCGPANKTCIESKGNRDLTEEDVDRMADYARWIGNPVRSEFTVSLPDVIAGEKVFRKLKCDTCHVIGKIDIEDVEDTMLSEHYRLRLAKHNSGSAKPFLSYIGTDLLMHDMGYLSQVATTNQVIRGLDGVVLPAFQNYVQKIRTPALKGMRFNRFVTHSHRNTRTDADPACDFLMHDGRACDAIEAAFIHDGPAISRLRVIQGLNASTADELRQLRAFLYSL